MASQTIPFEAIGTQWNIEVFEPLPADRLNLLKARILDRIEQFDVVYSRFRKDSLVTTMAHKAGSYSLPPDAKPLLELYAKLYEVSDGLVTPLIGGVLSDAGYDADYSLAPKQVTSPLPWSDALAYDFPNLVIKQPVLLDFGAAGKGYLVDIVADCITSSGVQHFCVNASGDMVYRTRAAQPLDVALENPDDATEAVGIAHIRNQSLCGSAGNRRAWGSYHHIMNPSTLSSPDHIKAVWVVADSGLLADGLTTALFFVSPERLQQDFGFEYAVINSDGSLRTSEHFPAQFFIQARQQ